MSGSARSSGSRPVEVPPELAQSITDAIVGTEDPDVGSDRPIGEQRDDFARFYMRYRELLQRRAYRYVSDPRDVEDLLQETFIRVFLALDELETERSAIRFAQRVLVNLCIDQYRSQQRRPRYIDLDAAACDPAEETFDDPLVRAEDAAVVREALAHLTPQHRAALIKREIEEKPFATIARELDVPEPQVRVLLHRARRALRRILVGSSVDPEAELTPAEVGALVRRRVTSAASNSAGRTIAIIAIVAAGFAACVAGLQPGSTRHGAVAGGVPSLSGPLAPAGPSDRPAGTAVAGQGRNSRSGHGTPAVPSHAAPNNRPTSNRSDGAPSSRRTRSTPHLTPTRPSGRPVGSAPRPHSSGEPFALRGLLRSRSATVVNQSHVAHGSGAVSTTADFVAQTNRGVFVMAQTVQVTTTPDGPTQVAGTLVPDVPLAGGGQSYVATTTHVTLDPNSAGYLVTMTGVATPPDEALKPLAVTVVAQFDSTLSTIGSEQVVLSSGASPTSGPSADPSPSAGAPDVSATDPTAPASNDKGGD